MGGRRARGAHANSTNRKIKVIEKDSSNGSTSSYSRGSLSAAISTPSTSSSNSSSGDVIHDGTSWIDDSAEWAVPDNLEASSNPTSWDESDEAASATEASENTTDMIGVIDFDTMTISYVPKSTLVYAEPKPKPKPEPYRKRETLVTTPQYHKLQPGEPVAVDGEWLLYRLIGGKWRQRWGWVSVKNTIKQTIFSGYVAYDNEEGVEKKIPYAPDKDFGIRRQDLYYSNGAVRGQEAEKILKKIFQNRPVVVHDARGDTNAFYYETDAFATSTIFDTQEMYYHHQPHGRGPGLATCVMAEFGQQMQKGGVHTPDEDAEWTMDLFLKQHPYDRVQEEAKLRAAGWVPDHEKNIGAQRGGRGRGRGGYRGSRGQGHKKNGERSGYGEGATGGNAGRGSTRSGRGARGNTNFRGRGATFNVKDSADFPALGKK